MKKLLALSGVGLSAVFCAMNTVVVPKLIGIVLVLFLNGQVGGTTFTTGSSISRDLVGFALDFFPTSGGFFNLFLGL